MLRTGLIYIYHRN